MMMLQVVVTILLALGCMAWIRVALAAARCQAQLPRVAELELPGPSRWPKVSVLVPARNEIDALEATARALMAEDYPELEILLVDDRSEDGTGALVDKLAQEDPRVRGLHLGKLPGGWLGKTRALHVAASQASGEWLLLTEADVRLATGALRQAMRWALNEGRDHVTLLPDVHGGGFAADAAGAASLRAQLVGLRLWAVADQGSDAFAGHGAFNLVRRELLEESDGLEGLSLDAADDLALGRLVKEAGGSSAFGFGSGLVASEGHVSLRTQGLALERRLYPLMACSFPRLLLAGSALVFFELAPWIAVAVAGVPVLQLLGFLALAGQIGLSLGLALRARRPLLPAAMTPAGTALLAWLALKAGLLGSLLKGVRWKDRFYTADVLRRGSSLSFPWWSLRRASAWMALLSLPRPASHVRT
jgi:hypothetical protein